LKTIDEMAAESFDNSVLHGWHDEPRSVGDLLALIHSEVSEALEAYRSRGYDRWLKPECKCDETSACATCCEIVDGVFAKRKSRKPEGIMSELADVVIRCGDMAERLRREMLVDQTLGEAIEEKHEFNKTRPYRHGGKRL
jgi:hypothetical protein